VFQFVVFVAVVVVMLMVMVLWIVVIVDMLRIEDETEHMLLSCCYKRVAIEED
jgi:hypothetical protein